MVTTQATRFVHAHVGILKIERGRIRNGISTVCLKYT